MHASTSKITQRLLLKRGAAALTAMAVLAGSAWWGAKPALADSVAPPAPANIRISPAGVSTDGTAILTWDASAASDVAYYQVFRYIGSAGLAANELTYLGRTEDARTYFIDHAPGEGTFRYAVMAVDTSGNAGNISAWVDLTVDLPANGSGTVNPDLTAPPAANGVSTGSAAYSRTRTVTLTWNPSQASDLWRYLVYRADGSGAPRMVAYVAAGNHSYTETVTADNTYRYYVVAQDRNGNASSASSNASIVVDATAPVVQMTSPVAGQTYLSNSIITIGATVTEGTAGYEPSSVRFYLDGVQQASSTINLSGLSIGAHTVRVEVTDRAGNTGSAQTQFLVGTDAQHPTAPRSLTVPQYSKTRSVVLNWSVPASGTPTRYLVYRTAPGASAVLAGAVAGTVTQLTDTVSADGLYAYYVVAENGTAVGQPSNPAAVSVDTVAPAITVGAPKSGQRVQKQGTLSVQVTVSDTTSGYEPAAVKLYLDGVPFTGTTINLAALSTGNHTFKVEATDRAGNTATKTRTFSVGRISDDDDDDDDDSGHGRKHHRYDREYRQDLINLLVSLRAQIHHGQYNALMKKAEKGNLKSFVKLVKKHRGKQITPAAADELLKALDKD